MTNKMETRYDPESVEERINKMWIDNDLFHAEPTQKSRRGNYSIVIPPPNVTGMLHLGHALNNTLQDILIRYRRMRGHNTLWMPGTDHAGIATQSVVEKQLLEKEGKTRHDLGRDELVGRIWDWRDQYGDRILQQLRRIGCSCDWARTRFTLDDVCARAVRTAFFKLFEAGLIYRGRRLVNWDPITQTALADDELEHETINTSFWYITYPLANGSGNVTVATTRPETMLGDTAVAINPKDPRAKALVGKTVLLPLMNREIPIVADSYVTLPNPDGDEKAKISTGFLKVTPAHDPNDYEIGLRHNLPLINIFNHDASINENGGKYQGMDRFDARKAVLRDLEKLGLLVKAIPYSHEVGHSYRSKAPVEPYLSNQWFIATRTLADTATKVVNDGRVKFFPKRYADTYLDWLANLHDWCISRQLWWGHRMPIWYCNNHDCYDPKQYESCEAGSSDVERSERRFFFSGLEDPTTCPKCGGGDIEQDPDVLDTWFSSALWPFSTMGWPDSTPELEAYYPTSVLITSRDIISLWVCRMVMMGCFNLNEVPFGHVYIHTKILDGKGETMSKSKGNGVDPLDIISNYGADAMRFSLAYMTTETQDARMPVTKEKLPDGREINVSEKFEIGRNFCNKLWNASRFVIGNLEGVADAPPVSDDELTFDDRWILSRLAYAADWSTIQLEKTYGFSEYAETLYDFVWHEFCDWYVELAKPRLAGGGRPRQVAQKVLAFVLDNILRLLHPVLCFETEDIWQRLNDMVSDRSLNDQLPAPPCDALIIAAWPEIPQNYRELTTESDMILLESVVRPIRNVRAQYGISPREKLHVLISAGHDVKDFLRHTEFIKLTAGLDSLEVGEALPKPPHSATIIVGEVLIYVLLEGATIDLKVERARLEKRAAELQKGLAALKKKLTNENFISRAPAEVVQSEQARHKVLQDELTTIQAGLSELAQQQD